MARVDLTNEQICLIVATSMRAWRNEGCHRKVYQGGESTSGAPRSKAHVAQLFGVAHHIDCDNAAAVVLESQGVDRPILFAQHKAGEAVHGRRTALHARQGRILAADAAKETKNFISAVD